MSIGGKMVDYAVGRNEALAAALAHLQNALEILDRVEAPAQIGAHIDLARCQLLDILESRGASEIPVNISPSDRASRH